MPRITAITTNSSPMQMLPTPSQNAIIGNHCGDHRHQREDQTDECGHVLEQHDGKFWCLGVSNELDPRLVRAGLRFDSMTAVRNENDSSPMAMS